MSVTARAARVWTHRHRIELEAVHHFQRLAADLEAAGAGALAARARAAADDERDHAARCAALVARLDPAATAPAPPSPPSRIGPIDGSPRQRALYAAVAIGCITESLSCALLLALREVTTHPAVAATVAAIARDEVEHARLGWATLAALATPADHAWLAAHVPAMRAAAIADEIGAATGDDELAAYGVLPPARARSVVDPTWDRVIAPGLARHGVSAMVAS